jgi:acetylornithine deacetylase/succinyl-diaminopimelate desuccinylase-like protein
MEQALTKSVALIFTGGGAVQGAGGGQVLVEGTSFIFQDYSPDGELIIGGQLDMELLASPVTLKGTIQLSGSMEFEVVVDMTIDVTQDPFTYGGTLTVDEEVFDVTELQEEANS